MIKADVVAGLIESPPDPSDPLVIVPEPDIGALKRSGAGSVDMRLGTWFTTLRPARIACLEVRSAASTGQPATGQLTKTHYVRLGATYALHPRNFVLGTTVEWLRLPRGLAAYVIGKSSWGRRGLIIATATVVHPGFAGCLTLELSNVGEIPIKLKAGMKVCQICFHRCECSEESDSADQSRFVGYRRPVLGALELDTVASQLEKAYGVATRS